MLAAGQRTVAFHGLKDYARRRIIGIGRTDIERAKTDRSSR